MVSIRTGIVSCWIAVIPVIGFAERFDGFDDYVEAARRHWQVPGVAVAIIKDGEIVLARGYGWRTIDRSSPVDAETVFPLASITKNFTATATALLVDQGKLQWDDPVRAHLPEIQFSDSYRTEHTTIRDLLSHRTGLERGDLLPRRRDISRSEVIRRIRYLQPTSDFRSQWGYNNLMYILAGEVIGTATDSSWKDFVTEHLFHPLEMNDTAAVRKRIGSRNRATAHRLIDGKLRSVERAIPDHVMGPAGAAHSNVIDMAKWLTACLPPQPSKVPLIRPTTLREMQSLQTSIPVTWDRGNNPYAARFYGSGLGWMVLDYRGRMVCNHGGSAGTMMAIMPEEGIGVVVLTNLDWTNLAGMLMYDVFDAYLEGAEVAWDRTKWDFWKQADPHPDVRRQRDVQKAREQRAEDTEPELDLAGFAGQYRCDLYGDLIVGHHHDHLQIRFGRNSPAQATHWDHNRFYVRWPVEDDPHVDWLVQFHLDQHKCIGLSIERLGWHEPMPDFDRVQ